MADGHGGGSAATAAGLFEEELSLLGERGWSYYRGCALLCLARAQAIGGQAGAALATIDASISLAREAGCRGLYVDALETRLRFRTGE